MLAAGFQQKPQARRYQHKYASRLKCREELEKELYSSPIDVYDTPPNFAISVAEFEKYALARLKALRIIERANLMEHVKYSQEWKNQITNDFRKQNLTEFLVVINNGLDYEDSALECRKFDHISHFLLRLAFAQTEEQRKWFITMEMDMFRLKLAKLSNKQMKEFLKQVDFPGELVLESEKNTYRNQLCSTFGGPSNMSLIDADMYKLEFIHAIDLVRQRKVFLLKGKAFLLYTDVVTVICGLFRSHLSESLSLIKKNIHHVEQDTRIMQLITDFDRRHTGSDYGTKKNVTGVTVDELPTLSIKSFPLCMKSLYDVVVKDHHLKHFGRLQLGLFLKGIGMPMDEATKFWRMHFTKKPEIDGSRFDKQYLYNIRHMYGQEGKRADYTPYSCMKVITSNVGTGDFHGCPFKHSDPASLRQKLVDAEIPSKGVSELMSLLENHHYQIACQKYFEFTHGGMAVDGGVNHPNQYFEESRDVLTGRKTIKPEEKLKTTHVKVYAQKSDTQNSIPDEFSSIMDDPEDEALLANYATSQGW